MDTSRFLPVNDGLNGQQQGDGERQKPTILLVDDRCSNGSLLVRQLRTLGFSCSFARSIEEAKLRLSAQVFDVILSKLRMNGSTAYELRPLLIGRPSSLFYSLAVEEDCWWIPGVRRGTECLGEPAMRPDEFFKTLISVADAGIAAATDDRAGAAN